MKLTANINEIKLEVDALAKASKTAANETSAINAKLRFDPSNVTLVVQRFDALQKELEENTKKIQGLQKAQERLNEGRAKEKGDTKESKQNLADIEKLASQYARDLERAQAAQERLVSELKQTNKNSQIINAVTRQVNTQYEVWLKVSNKLTEATKKIYNTLKNVVTKASEVGVQLYSTAKRYNTTAEDIQTWNRALQLATGQSELFTQSLSTMVQGMAQIAAGRGVAFTKALKNIGISYQEIKDLSASEQFEKIVEGLAQVENYSARAAAAQQLFGESGQYIASVLNDGGAALEGYREEAEKFGITSNSNVEALARMNILIEQAKSQITEAKNQLAAALLPVLEVITDLIGNVLAPALRKLGDLFKSLGKGGQVFAVVLGAFIILLPRVISLISKATIVTRLLGQQIVKDTIAAIGLKTALFGILGIVGVIGVIGGITAALVSLNNQADETADSIKDMSEVAKSAGLIGSQAQVNTESTATSMYEKTVTIGVDIYGHGETSVSDDTAVTIAQLTADQVDRALGELTK